MRCIVVYIYLMCIGASSYSQFNYLDTVFKVNNYSTEFSYSSIKLADNKYVLVGYGFNTKYEINIFSINVLGDTLWSSQYNVDSVGIPWVIRATLDNDKNILVAGYVAVNNSAEIRSLLLKTDSLGHLKWIRFYREDSVVFTEYTGLYGYIPVSTFNNEYLLICQWGRDTDVSNFLAIVTDSMGMELTRWKYYNPYYEVAKFAIQTSDSGFLFGGYSDRLDPDTLPYYWTMYIKKVDKNGILVWDTSIQALSTGGYIYTGDAIAQDAIEVDDGYVIAGERSDRSNFTYPNDERGWAKCWYGKFNKNDGHLLWEHYVGPDTLDYGEFAGITHTKDGGYALCGGYNYARNKRGKGLIIKTDSLGDPMWSYTINRHVDSLHYTEQMELHDIYEIEGGYMATGWRIPNWPFDANPFPYVLTLDSNGCPMYNCQPTDIRELKEAVDINLYPNPANTLLNILVNSDNPETVLTLNIYDINGRLLLKEEHLSAGIPFSLNVSAYAKGMYFVEVMSGGEVVARRKFVKSGP